MKKVQKLFKLSVLVLLFLTMLPVFAEVNIISPSSKSDVWANKQTLVINATEGEDIFYTFTGNNPLETGFAYDEPVLIDAVGEVELYITSINKKKERTDYVIKYSVDETLNSQLQTVEETAFIKKLNESPVYSVYCGLELSIPVSFNYSISLFEDDDTMEAGRTIYVSQDSTLERYVSLVLKNNAGSYWNYILHVSPSVKGEFSKAAVPFEITEWSKVTFLDNKYIYSIDDGWWQRYGQTFDIDRSKPHVIKWQSVDYDAFNPIQSFQIPPTPGIKAELQENASIVLTLEGDDSYRFAGTKSSQISFPAAGLHEKIVVDAFQGENFSTLLPLDIYSENVYQGRLYAAVQVNRKRPAMPKIILSSTAEVSRDDVSFTIEGAKEGHNIKYFVYGPEKLSFEQITYSASIPAPSKLDSSLFTAYENNKIELKTEHDTPVLYRVYAYSVDKWDNVSEVQSQAVLIDKCNYFVKADSNVSEPDGTINKPYNNLKELESIINNNTFTNLYVYGSVTVNSEELNFKHDLSINGINNAELVLGDKASLNVTGANCTINNLLIKNANATVETAPVMISVSNGILSVNNSEFSFGKYKSAVLINASKSIVKLQDSGFTSYANEYAAVLSSNNSKVTVKNSRLSTVASTNVNISIKKSKLTMTESECTVSGLNGRIAELFSSEAVVTSNSFTAKGQSSKSSNDSIWKDEKSKIDDSRNKLSGF